MSELESVICRDVTHYLMPGTFYHLTSLDDFLLWNVKLAEGLCPSASLQALAEGMQGIVTPYFIANSQPQKEDFWESIRVSDFPHLPSRHKALFLFESIETATAVQQSWFLNENRILLEARIVYPSQIHLADTKWLDSPESEWESAARNYWSEIMAKEPIPEIIVHGCVYFPGWKEPPFGTPPGLGS